MKSVPSEQLLPAPIPALLTRKQLSSYFAVTEQHVDHLMKRWGIPRIELGRSVRYPAASIFTAIRGKGGLA